MLTSLTLIFSIKIMQLISLIIPHTTVWWTIRNQQRRQCHIIQDESECGISTQTQSQVCPLASSCHHTSEWMCVLCVTLSYTMCHFLLHCTQSDKQKYSNCPVTEDSGGPQHTQTKERKQDGDSTMHKHEICTLPKTGQWTTRKVFNISENILITLFGALFSWVIQSYIQCCIDTHKKLCSTNSTKVNKFWNEFEQSYSNTDHMKRRLQLQAYCKRLHHSNWDMLFILRDFSPNGIMDLDNASSDTKHLFSTTPDPVSSWLQLGCTTVHGMTL